MFTQIQAETLIAAFWESLRLYQLEKCQTHYEDLVILSKDNLYLVPWCDCFAGIIAFDFHKNWSESDRIFKNLLQTKLEPILQAHLAFVYGRSLDARGQWLPAIEQFKQSAVYFQQINLPIQQARATRHIGITYQKGFDQGIFNSSVLPFAIEACHQALDLLNTLPLATLETQEVIWLKGSIWNTLGAINLSLGQWSQAIDYYQQDLASCQQDDTLGIGFSLGNIGEVYLQQGDLVTARNYCERALALIQQSGEQLETIDALNNLGFICYQMEQLNLALDYYLKAINLIELVRANNIEEEDRATFFATTINIFAHVVLIYVELNQFSEAFNMVERAKSRAFLDSLASSPETVMTQFTAPTLTLAQIQAALPANAILLEYFTIGVVESGVYSPNVSTYRHRFPPAKIMIFGVTLNNIMVHEVIGLQPNQLYSRQLNTIIERHFLEPKRRQSLYNYLIAPITTWFDGKERIYLVPHGPLHYIPFHTLLAPDGDTWLREVGPDFVYGPSATILFQHSNQPLSIPKQGCLAFGYNQISQYHSIITTLHYAEQEAQKITQIMGGQALTGQSQKKATLYTQAPYYRWIHFSCHGEFNPAEPLASTLHLGPNETLTALDVLNHLHLQCDLVTLSACESGLNLVRQGDELMGFTRAFMFAGAKALVTTLWRVDEYSTLLFMEQFYQAIQAGYDLAIALKQAQLYLRNLTYQDLQPLPQTYSNPSAQDKILGDPSYWGAFILLGQPNLGG